MSNILYVTLDTSITPPALDVADGNGENKVVKDKNNQTVKWQLTGNLKNANFVAMDDANPGFAWIGIQPPAGVFDKPKPPRPGTSLTVVDHHHNNQSDGTWFYVLRVISDGALYTTISASTPKTTTNPVIKNT